MVAEAGRGRVPLSSPCCPEAPHLRLLHQGSPTDRHSVISSALRVGLCVGEGAEV